MEWAFSDLNTRGALVFTAVFLGTFLLWSRRRENNKLPPALPWLPVLGSLPFVSNLQHMPSSCLKASKKYGDVFAMYSGSLYVVVLNGRETLRHALCTKSVDFADRRRPLVFSETRVNTGLKGIFCRNYDAQLKTNRQLSLSILKEFGFGKRIMENRILIEVEEFVKEINGLGGKPFEPHHTIMSSVMNLFMSLLFGRRYDHQDPFLLELVSSVETYLNSMPVELDVFPSLQFVPYYRQKIKDYEAILIKTLQLLKPPTMACLQEDPREECYVANFVDALQPNDVMDELRFILRDFIVAGSDTLTTTLRWAVVNITNHPKVQSRLHAEIDSNVGRQRLPTLEDRPRLPYVEATMLEVMRHDTAVPLAMLHATSCDTEINGYFVPAKTVVIANLYSAHMDPDDWQDPEIFNPDRFLDHTGNVIGRDRIVPFSLGKRQCLGEQLARQEVFLYLAALLQNFDFFPPEGHDRIEVGVKPFAVFAPTHFNVRLVPRKA